MTGPERSLIGGLNSIVCPTTPLQVLLRRYLRRRIGIKMFLSLIDYLSSIAGVGAISTIIRNIRLKWASFFID